MGQVHAISSFPTKGTATKRYLSETQRSKSHEILFNHLQMINDQENHDLAGIKRAIKFTKNRLNNVALKPHRKHRLTERLNQLTKICNHFEKNGNNGTFIGLVGWGDGCITNGIKSRQNLSAVDGFLYKDITSGETHYQRLGSCHEYFLDPPQKKDDSLDTCSFEISQTEPADRCANHSLLYQTKGIDINLNQLTCSILSTTLKNTKPIEVPISNMFSETTIASNMKPIQEKLYHPAKDTKGTPADDTDTPQPKIIVKETSETSSDIWGFKIEDTSLFGGRKLRNKRTKEEYKFRDAELNEFKRIAGNLIVANNEVQLTLPKIEDNQIDIETSVGKEIKEIQENINGIKNNTVYTDEFKTLFVSIELCKYITLIAKLDAEGCFCCGQALDLDELVGISKIDSNGNTEFYTHVAEGPTVSIELGIAYELLALLGLTAAYRNIKGGKETHKQVSALKAKITKKLEKYKEQHEQWQNEEEKKNVIISLEAHLRTIDYSLGDSLFNQLVPGALNGIASFFIAITPLLKTPLGLPAMAGYGLCQAIRNGGDFIRIRVQNTQPINKNDLSKDEDEDLGAKKLIKRKNEKQRFFAVNAVNFLCLSAGALITFVSLPALGLGLGAATLPVGIALLAYGAGSTAIGNNIWPKKFIPRNGFLGADRTTLNSTKCITILIGKKRKQKTILKEHQPKKDISLRFKIVCCQVLKAFPAIPGLPTGIDKGNQLENNLRDKWFDENRLNLVNVRTEILKNLTNTIDANQGSNDQHLQNNPYNQFSDLDKLKHAWNMCKTLGIHGDIIQELVKTSKTQTQPDKHGCTEQGCSGCQQEPQHELIAEFDNLEIFKKGTLTLKENLSPEKQKMLGTEIDRYLIEMKKRLRYEERGLMDFYWAREAASKKI